VICGLAGGVRVWMFVDCRFWLGGRREEESKEGGRSGLGPIASARQSGRSTRPICGAAVSSAAISGSDRRCCSWLREQAAVGTKRMSQSKVFGSRRGRGDGGRTSLSKPSPRPSPASGRGRVCFAHARRVAEGTAPAWTRAARAAKRLAARRSLVQIRMMSGPATKPPRDCAATVRHSKSMMRAKRSITEGGAAFTNRT
jgi:hypothetical protein